PCQGGSVPRTQLGSCGNLRTPCGKAACRRSAGSTYCLRHSTNGMQRAWKQISRQPIQQACPGIDVMNVEPTSPQASGTHVAATQPGKGKKTRATKATKVGTTRSAGRGR